HVDVPLPAGPGARDRMRADARGTHAEHDPAAQREQGPPQVQPHQLHDEPQQRVHAAEQAAAGRAAPPAQAHPFTEPISTPWVKKRCRKGEMISSGSEATIITEDLISAARRTCSTIDPG